MIYDNQRDANSRLSGTIVLWENKAARVLDVTENLGLFMRQLSTTKEAVLKQDDAALQLISPPLGYANLKRGAVYLVRKPVRMWKQGLDPRQLWMEGRPVLVRAQWDGPEFTKCYDGDYPTIDKAVKMFKGTNPFAQESPETVAFSRQWAVGKRGELLYKNKEVGRMGDRLTLNDKYGWLAEALEESLNGQG